jgi:hypothetical protein
VIAETAQSTIVRSATVGDLAAIGRLFSPPKPVALLQWLLGEGDGRLRSLVAAVDGEIVGHVGYTLSTFGDGTRLRKGVYPILWKVREDCKGAVGLRLLTRVLRLADFSYVIGGSVAAQKLYHVLGYRALFELAGYRKTLSLRGLGTDLLSRRGARAVRMRSQALLAAFGRSCRDVSVASISGSGESVVATGRPGSIANIASPVQLQWAAACPMVEAHHLTLSVEGHAAGPVLCYVRRAPREAFTGTIVYMPHLGSQAAVWSAALCRIENFLVRKGCSQVTILASDTTLVSALRMNGFALDRSLPFWFRGTGEALRDWYVTFLEGDLGYRK